MSNTSPSVVRVVCPAKINLSLRVGPPRNDGLHPISSWMICVSFADDLEVRCAETGSTFDVGWADSAPRPTAIDWPIEQDLAFRAHRLMERHVGRTLPVHAELRKRVPTGAGMGGGSSDAAGMLRGLNRLFDLRLSRESLGRLAAGLGSDVPFFLGPPSAIVNGMGDTIEPAPLEKPIYLTLVFPSLHCNTGAVYRKFDELNPDPRLVAIHANNKAHGVLTNDLAEPAFAVEPRLRELRDSCVSATGKSVQVTGSGAGLFVIHPDAASAASCARRIRERCGTPALPASTLKIV